MEYTGTHTHTLLEYSASHYPSTDRPTLLYTCCKITRFLLYVYFPFLRLPLLNNERLHSALLSSFRSERQEYILIFFKERGNRKVGRIFPPPVVFIISILLYCVFYSFFTVPFCFSGHRNSTGFEPESIIFEVPPFFSMERTFFIPLN